LVKNSSELNWLKFGSTLPLFKKVEQKVFKKVEQKGLAPPYQFSKKWCKIFGSTFSKGGKGGFSSKSALYQV